MFRKKFSNLSRLVASIKQGGQVSILFAFLMPIFILFLGVALDLGWYYLNVSRLQNAADAAAVAGAQTLINSDSDNFSDYKNVTLISKYPGKVSNQYRPNDSALEMARVYAGKNLSGEEGVLVNSWTKNEVETEGPTLYEQGDNLYFVVQLKDTIKHFFLPGWFDDMTAPVTAVAMMTKEPDKVVPPVDNTPDNALEDKPSTPQDFTIISSLPDMPVVANNELVNKELNDKLNSARNKNVIVGNWEVQNAYKSNDIGFQAHFPYKVYDKAWNHFQDMANHYTIGDLYRKQTVKILDSVTTKGQIPGTYTSDTFNGSDVHETDASWNNNPKSNAYNPGKDNKKGYPYLGERVDSLNIDFKPEVTLSGDWLKQDWDLKIEENFPADEKYIYKSWASTTVSADKVKRLRIHSSLNFNGAYKVRTNEEFLEREDDGSEKPPLVKNEKGEPVTDILWVRIESEPILSSPDTVYGYKTGMKIVTGLNSVNQIIININASNYDEGDNHYRPVIIFYDGPETNDIYYDKENKKHVRDSLPVILNLNKPFRGVLYAPKSPVVIIGDCKDNFRGFVVAKEYQRLKNEDDDNFEYIGYTNRPELSIYGARKYKDKATGKTCYKITDENGIEMFVDERGDILFEKLDTSVAPKRYGTYDNFERTDFSTENYKVLKESANNMLLSGD